MNRIFSLALLVWAAFPARACDVCGCSASNQYLGVLPDARFNFVGLQYQYNQFRSNHPSLFDSKQEEKSRDDYHNVQLWGRYNIGKRIQLFAFLPYRYNQQRQDSTTTTSSGIGDVSVLANVLLINDNSQDKKWQQQLLAGGGLKLPTGTYTGITSMDKQGLPNMQPGSGSWDFIINTNYTLRRNNIGINADAAYTITLPNSENYKYGNRLNTGVTTFYSIKKKQLTVLPQLGARYEYTLHDYDNYSRKWLNEQSGGYMCFATAGIQLYSRKAGARITYSLPVSQHYGAGYVTAIQKIDVGVFFLFQ